MNEALPNLFKNIKTEKHLDFYINVLRIVFSNKFKATYIIENFSNIKDEEFEYDCYDGFSKFQDFIAEEIVQVLKAMKAPGAKYLYLTEKSNAANSNSK